MQQMFALAFPAIDPVAFPVGPFEVRWYSLAYMAGLIGGWLYARRLVRRPRLWGAVRRPREADLDDMLLWCALGVVLGGRVGYVLFYNFDAYLADPAEILAVWHGGMSFHGGFLGTVLAIVLFARSRGLSALSLLDLAAAVVPIGLFFGRVANFINGELWGRTAPDLPWAFVFPTGGPVPRHPSQLYEALGEGLFLFMLLALIVRLGALRRPGLVGGVFVAGYALARVVCELFREPDAHLGYLFGGWVTIGMLLSIPMLLLGLWGIANAYRTRRKALEDVPEGHLDDKLIEGKLLEKT